MKTPMFNEVERFLVKKFEEKQVPGFSASVVSSRDIVWSKGFGYSNLEEGVPATIETVYRVASVSKPVIATGLLQWMDRGLFHLDDPVNSLLKDVKVQTDFEEQPTIRNLLSHTSGLPVHVDPICFDLSETISLEEMIRESAITVRPPNQEIVYSNTAFNIIGYLVGLFAGKPYPECVREGLFEPLEMYSSDFEQTSHIRGLMAQPYSRKKDGPIEAVTPWYGGSIPEKPCGSLFSTAIDLGHFLISQMNGGIYKDRRILKEETVEEMHRLQSCAGSSRSGYALAWKRTWHHGTLMLSHTGGNLGWTAHVAFYPELKTGMVILCNLNDNSGWRPPAREALRLVVGGILSFDPETIKRRTVPGKWNSLKGIYTRRLRRVQVDVDDGNLILQRDSDKAYLEEIDEIRYLVHGGAVDGMELTFEFDERGMVKQIDLETEAYTRFIEDERAIEEDADLTGTWHGKYVHPHGYFTMDLTIYNKDRASATDMGGNTVPIIDFKAHLGRVKGSFRFKILPGYTGWGADEFETKINLSAIKGRLEGHMELESEISKSNVPLVLTKI